MKKLQKSLVTMSVVAAALASSQVLAGDLFAGRCSQDAGRINVTGQGEVKVMPDRVRLSYQVSAIKDTAEEARNEVEETVGNFAEGVATLNLEKDSFIYPKRIVDVSLFPQ